MTAIEPFRIHVDDAVLDDLRDRLGTHPLPGPDRRHRLGVRDPDRLPARAGRVLARRVRLARRRRRGSTSSTTSAPEIDGQSIHFVHARSPHAGRAPAAAHARLAGLDRRVPRRHPAADRSGTHGGAPTTRSTWSRRRCPGYGFSEPPREPGWDIARIARAFVELMDRLGYARYGAQGGDWGAQVTTRIGALDPEHCVGAPPQHADRRTAAGRPLALTDEEQADLAAMARVPARGRRVRAASRARSRRRSASRSNDSPAGLLAWIVEKFRDVERLRRRSPRTASPATSCSRT